MMDRERAIKRINALLDISDDDDFMILPILETIEVLEDVRELLKAQEPVEPYVTTGHGTGFESAISWWYACGNCNEPIDLKDKFCRHCGRAVKAVKWE